MAVSEKKMAFCTQGRPRRGRREEVVVIMTVWGMTFLGYVISTGEVRHVLSKAGGRNIPGGRRLSVCKGMFSRLRF
jgi:hypothetical protein